MRKKTKESLHKLEEQHRAYEKMIDEIMRKHIEEEQLPLMLEKLVVRHKFNNFRVIKPDESSKVEKIIAEATH